MKTLLNLICLAVILILAGCASSDHSRNYDLDIRVEAGATLGIGDIAPDVTKGDEASSPEQTTDAEGGMPLAE